MRRTEQLVNEYNYNYEIMEYNLRGCPRRMKLDRMTNKSFYAEVLLIIPSEVDLHLGYQPAHSPIGLFDDNDDDSGEA